MIHNESDAFEQALRAAKLPAPPGTLRKRVEDLRTAAARAAAKPAANEQPLSLRPLILLAACALLGVFYLLSPGERRTPGQQPKPGTHPIICRFADGDDFRAKARVAAIIGDTAILEHLDTGKQSIARKGSVIAGYEVLSIAEDRIELQSTSDKSDTFTIKLQGGAGQPPALEELRDPLEDIPTVPVFHLEGTVTDVYGKPMKGVKVYPIILPGRSCSWAVTDDSGYYRASDITWEISQLEFKIDDVGYYQYFEIIEGPWSKNATVDLDLRARGYFEIKGVVCDDGKPVFNVQVGNFDDQAVDANGYDATIATSTDNMGAFALLAKEKITSLSVLIFSETSRFSIPKKGPWSANTELVIDIAEERKSLNNYHGHVIGLNGQPLVDAWVFPTTQQDNYMFGPGCTVGKDGRYSFPTQEKADWICVDAGNITAIVPVNPENPNINIDLKNLELTKYHGRVTLDGSTPVKGMAVRLSALYTSVLTATDENGEWTLHTNDTFISLEIFGDGVSLHYAIAPQDRLASNIAADTFTISGSVADTDNRPVAGASIDALNQAQRRPRIGQTYTDENGKFTFKTNILVQFLTVGGNSPFFQGPWDKDTVVELKLP